MSHITLNRSSRFRLTRLDVTVLLVVAGCVTVIALTAAIGIPRKTLRVAYLGPALSAVQNIWLADPAHPEDARPITDSPSGVFDFNVSPDGKMIAFSEYATSADGSTSTEIRLLDVDTGRVRPLTACAAENTDCHGPVWRPDGQVIAYERMGWDSGVPGIGASPVRVWLIDLSFNPPQTTPLFEDSQILGYGPQWSADGSQIALVDSSSQSIVVYDFQAGSMSYIPNPSGTSGALSPNGKTLVFADLIRQGNQIFSYLRRADLATNQYTNLTLPDDPVDDTSPAWNPDGKHLAISRRYLDDRWTQGHQVYLMDADDGSVQPLVVDDRYTSSFFQWDASGDKLLMQRFPELDADRQTKTNGLPEIWVYDMDSGDLVMVSDNGYYPRWVP